MIYTLGRFIEQSANSWPSGPRQRPIFYSPSDFSPPSFRFRFTFCSIFSENEFKEERELSDGGHRGNLEKTDHSKSEKMVICYISATNMDATDNQEIITDKNMPNVPNLHAGHDGFASDSSLTCSELEKMDEYTEVNVPSDHGNENHNLSNKIHDDVSANAVELAFKTCHADDRRTKEEGHQFRNQKVFNAGSFPVESNASKHWDVCAEFGQFDYVSSSSSKVEENENAAISTTSTPSSINLGEFEVRDGTHEENCNMEPGEASASVGAQEKPEYEMQQLVPKLGELELISQKFDTCKDDFPSVIEFEENVTLHKEMEEKTEIYELNYDGAQNGVNSGESSPSPCLNAFTFKLDGLEAHLHVSAREISETQEHKSGKSSSFETDVLSMSEIVPDSGAVPITDTEDAIGRTKIPKRNQVVVNEEPEVDHISVEEFEEKNAWSWREVTPNPIGNFSESKTPSDDDIRSERRCELVATIDSSTASFRVVDINSEGENSTSVTHSDQVNQREVVHKQLEDPDGPLSHELDPCSLIQDQSNKHSASLATENISPEAKVQVDQITEEYILSNLPCEELECNEANQNAMNHHYAQSSIPIGDIIKLEDTQACDDTSVEFASATCFHSLQDQSDQTVFGQKSNAAPVVADSAVNSSSQADSAEVQWGSIYDGAVPSTSHHGFDGVPVSEAFTSPVTSELHASTSGKEDTNAETENSDLFEAPSFLTLVEPGLQLMSNEIQPVPKGQLTKSSPFRDKRYPESPKRKGSSVSKGEEIFANGANWSPGRRYVPLETLLYEANLQSKQRTLQARDRSMLPLASSGKILHGCQILPRERESLKATKPKMANQKYKETFAGGNKKEWNTPARLPIVRKRRGRLPWNPFICCPSAN